MTMPQTDQPNQTNTPDQSTRKDDKQNLQKMNKSGAGNNQADNEKAASPGKMGQNEDADIDEKTNIDQRTGDFQGGAKRQAAGQSGQPDQSGTRGDVENSASGRQQENKVNDEDIESDRTMPSARSGVANKNSQSGADSDKRSNRPSDNDNKTSK